jgi:hypothetical protein
LDLSATSSPAPFETRLGLSTASSTSVANRRHPPMRRHRRPMDHQILPTNHLRRMNHLAACLTHSNHLADLHMFLAIPIGRPKDLPTQILQREEQPPDTRISSLNRIQPLGLGKKLKNNHGRLLEFIIFQQKIICFLPNHCA